MPNGGYGPCTAAVEPHQAGGGPRSPQPPPLAYLLLGSLHPSFMFKLTLGAEAGRRGGLSAPRLQRCGPAVSRLIQSNLPLSQAGTPGWSPPTNLILTPRGTANNPALVNTTNSTLGGGLGGGALC